MRWTKQPQVEEPVAGAGDELAPEVLVAEEPQPYVPEPHQAIPRDHHGDDPRHKRVQAGNAMKAKRMAAILTSRKIAASGRGKMGRRKKA